MIALIDYGSGNLRSVRKALEHVGAVVQLVDSPGGLAHAEAVVLPGVGAFGDSARNLRERGLWDPLLGWLQRGQPFLGICLGYQLLFESSEESPGVDGFGYFRGKVERFRDTSLKIPHMGWNTLAFANGSSSLYRGVADGSHVYFVHSFFPVPEDSAIISATTSYGGPFAASVEKNHVAAVQFHPEKSQGTGLALLRNFISSVR